MKRRDYLRLTAGALAVSTTGCLSTLRGDEGPDNTYLGPPDDPASEAVRHPKYGDAVPEAEMPDVFTDGYVSTDRDSPYLLTFFYSFCPTECIWIISSLVHAEAEISEAGVEKPRVLAASFDPARDTPEELREYADRMGVDAEAGNWSFLRPEDEETAEEVIEGEFGVKFTKTGDGELYDFIHTTVILLVNSDGYVERTYRNDNPDPHAMSDDWERLLEAEDEAEAEPET